MSSPAPMPAMCFLFIVFFLGGWNRAPLARASPPTRLGQARSKGTGRKRSLQRRLPGTCLAGGPVALRIDEGDDALMWAERQVGRRLLAVEMGRDQHLQSGNVWRQHERSFLGREVQRDDDLLR